MSTEISFVYKKILINIILIVILYKNISIILASLISTNFHQMLKKQLYTVYVQ